MIHDRIPMLKFQKYSIFYLISNITGIPMGQGKKRQD